MKEYLVRDNRKAALAIARDWAAIFLIAWANIEYNTLYLYIPSVWLIGGFQFAIGESLLHEAVHHNLFRQKKLNYRLEFLYALPFFRTVRQFRNEHIVHHNSLGRKEDQLVEDYQQLGLYKNNINFFYTWFIKPVLGFAAYYYVRTISLRPFGKEGWKILVFWIAVLAVFLATGKMLWLLKFWIIPLWWSCYSYLYWSEISDHFYTRTGTRSNLNVLTNLVTHNNGYHYVHHKYPTIPWFRLKRAYHDLLPAAGDISKGLIDTYRQIVHNKAMHPNDIFGNQSPGPQKEKQYDHSGSI